MSTWHVLFTGRVQGVGFRQSCSRNAEHLQLTGWVKNLPNGKVEATIQGEQAILQEWVSRCSSDNPFALVHSTEKTDKPDSILYSTFEIKY